MCLFSSRAKKPLVSRKSLDFFVGCYWSSDLPLQTTLTHYHRHHPSIDCCVCAYRYCIDRIVCIKERIKGIIQRYKETIQIITNRTHCGVKIYLIRVNVLFGSLLPVLFVPSFSLMYCVRTEYDWNWEQHNCAVCIHWQWEWEWEWLWVHFHFSFIQTHSKKHRHTHHHFVCESTTATIPKHINTNPVYRPICIAVTPCVIAFRGQHWNYRFNQISCSIHLSLGVYFFSSFFVSFWIVIQLTNEQNKNQHECASE